MSQYARPLAALIRELSKLPGIGGKTAQRLAFHILSLDDKEANALAESITRAKAEMKYCSICGNLTDKDPCEICSDPSRDHTTICVVEQAKDVAAMERRRKRGHTRNESYYRGRSHSDVHSAPHKARRHKMHAHSARHPGRRRPRVHR